MPERYTKILTELVFLLILIYLSFRVIPFHLPFILRLQEDGIKYPSPLVKNSANLVLLLFFSVQGITFFMIYRLFFLICFRKK